MQNRKIDIVVIKVMEVMEGITITLSSKLHNLVKKNGMKGESYEHIILRMSRQEFSQDFKKFQSVEAKEKPKPIVQQAKKPKEQRQAAKKIEKPIKAKPKAVKKVVKKKQAKPAQKKANAQEKLPVQAKKTSPSDELKQLRYRQNLELQRLKTELELAKLSNDTAKINEIALGLAKLKEEFNQ